MPDTATATATDDAVVIDDDSTVVDVTKLRKLATSFVNIVQEIIPLDATMTALYAKAALAKAQTRALALASDGMPDWTGATAAYRSTVAEMMDVSAFKGCSAARLETIKNNLKSHTRRGVLDGVIILWVRDNVQGMDKVEKGKEKDSPAFRKAMRAQYQRAHDLKLANPIACPDHWKDVQPSDVSVDAETEDTAASALNKAISTVTELSVPEVLDSLHRAASASLTPAVEINAKVKGGKDAAAAVARRFALQLSAAVVILEGKVDADAIQTARDNFAKYSYNENS